MKLLRETVNTLSPNDRRPPSRQVYPGLHLFLISSFCFSLIVTACATPVGVKRIDPRSVHRALTANILTTSRLSTPTYNVLYRRDLFTRFENNPEATMADLHAEVIADRGGRDDICALAELSFLYAEDSGKRSYYLAAMVYAYAFLFPGKGHSPADPFDPRFRLAADLYNRGITEGFKSGENANVEPRGGTFALPFGVLDVEFDPADLRWGSRQLTDFVPVAELQVTGLTTRYRSPGVGAPLAAGTVPLDLKQGFQDFVQPWAKVPVTAFLRIDEPRRQLMTNRIRASLRLDPLSGPDSVSIDGKTVPLEIESTGALAYTLAEAPVWQQELKGFLEGVGVIDEKSRLAALSPYKPGRMPVVLVHGTGSSAGRWGDMVNELDNDPRIREHFQFWLFSYNTGNPVLYSAMRLRESLSAALERLDPEHTDPALRSMVVIGHSQGGLLAKLTAIESDTLFWDHVSKTPLEKLALTQASRDLLYRMSFFHPLPFVRRLVFIATPQRGSYFAGSRLSHWVARFITAPLDIANSVNDLVLHNKETLAFTAMGDIPTAVHNMTPGTRFIRTLAAIPVVPGVATHSIIAVEGDGPAESGNDGIVEYSSAHLDGVDSELVVRSAHSCQSNPHTINEVRRILFLHKAEESRRKDSESVAASTQEVQIQ
jgi:pimeloyl-ACP methyl ester carboxylesterase